MRIPNKSQNSPAVKLVIALCLIALISSCSNKNKKNKDLLAQEQVETLYNKGKHAMDRGNYQFAIDYFRALEASYPYGDYTEQAKLNVIFSLNKSGKTEQAIEAADNFVKLYPTHPNVDYAYYMKGVASFEKKLGRIDKFVSGKKRAIRDPKPYRDSEAAFNELIQRFPESNYAADAKQRVVYIRNALAARELSIAQYYYDSETYVAAVNRCKNIIYKFETTPSVEKALVLMQRAYVKMGLDDLAVSTSTVLAENFPNSANVQTENKKRKSLLSRLNPFD